jgi:outer membrane protein TolC
MGPQQEILMAQTEKYMLLEREEMEKQKIQSLEAMLNAALGRDGSRPLGGRPEMPFYKPYTKNLDELIKESRNNNPMIRAKDKMAAASEARVQMAKKEFYPDLTVGGTYYARGEQYPDMWNLTATVNIPLFYKKKQEQGVLEAESTLQEAQKDVEATRAMVFSTLRDNYAMVKAAESLMALYKRGLILKVYQDFESALAGYTSGKVEAITVISRLKTLIDYELSYWNKFVEREKAIARLQAVAGIMDYEAGTK